MFPLVVEDSFGLEAESVLEVEEAGVLEALGGLVRGRAGEGVVVQLGAESLQDFVLELVSSCVRVVRVRVLGYRGLVEGALDLEHLEVAHAPGNQGGWEPLAVPSPLRLGEDRVQGKQVAVLDARVRDHGFDQVLTQEQVVLG